MGLLLRLGANTLAVWLTVLLVPGITFDGAWYWLVGIGLLLGIVNAIVRPVARLLSLPLRLVTLGLFTLVLNVGLMSAVVWLAQRLGFGISSQGAGPLLVGGAVLAVISWALTRLAPD